MKTHIVSLVVAAVCSLGFLTAPASAQVPQLISYQGRVAVGTVNFDGTGQFKFALVNGAGTTTYWSNDGTSTAGSQPTAAVALTVTKGLYSVLLGDAALANMTAIPAGVFNNADVRLRVWFNDGTNGSQLLTPDQRIAAVGYAMIANGVPSGAITSAMIANGAVGTAQLGAGAVGGNQLAAGAASANLGASGQAGVASGGNCPFRAVGQCESRRSRLRENREGGFGRGNVDFAGGPAPGGTPESPRRLDGE